MSSPTVYLVSGANRGVGLAMVTILASRPNTVVFAGARNPAKADALQALAKALPDSVHIVKLTSADTEDNEAAVREIEAKAGKLDVVIANAGIEDQVGPILTTHVSEFDEHFRVNTVGVIVLFQSTYRLLVKSSIKKFIAISTLAASIGGMIPFPVAAYSASKVALNYVVKKMALEQEADKLITRLVHPGMVATEMGISTLERVGVAGKFPTITAEESARGVIQRVDEASLENNGTFVDQDGNELPW